MPATHGNFAAPVIRGAEPVLDNLIKQYSDMNVVEIPVTEAFDRLDHNIDGMETTGAPLLA